MKNTMKQISMILFGTAAWMVCAVVAPMQQGTENTGLFAAVASLAVPAAYADVDDDDKDKDKDKSSSVQTGSVCVSLALLTESIGKDKTKEDGKAEDEHDKKDTEFTAKADEEEYAKVEYEYASEAELHGDYAGKREHEEDAKEHEDKAKDHEDKAKEHEDKAEEHEDKSASYSGTKTNVESLAGNCNALVNTGGSVTTEPGVWIPGTPDYVSNMLDQDGGANTLIDSISSNGGATVDNSAPDAYMESYREIRGE